MSGRIIILNKKAITNLCIIAGVIFSISLVCLDFIGNSIEVANSNRLLPIYSVETNKKQVAITFDCAWGADDIPSIIDTLNKNKVKATFFTVGDWVSKNSEAVSKLNEAGMEIR